jgi:hypothetical protein
MWGFLKEVLAIIRSLVNWFYKRKKTLREDLDASTKIIYILDKLIDDSNADRSTVYQFHNGDYFYTGHSIDKMSCTHEQVEPGISREQLGSQGIFTSSYRALMFDLLNKEVLIYKNVEEIEDYNTRIYFSRRGASSVVLTLLRDMTTKPVGIVGLEFVRSHFEEASINKRSIVQAAVSILELLVYGRIKNK